MSSNRREGERKQQVQIVYLNEDIINPGSRNNNNNNRNRRRSRRSLELDDEKYLRMDLENNIPSEFSTIKVTSYKKRGIYFYLQGHYVLRRDHLKPRYVVSWQWNNHTASALKYNGVIPDINFSIENAGIRAMKVMKLRRDLLVKRKRELETQPIRSNNNPNAVSREKVILKIKGLIKQIDTSAFYRMVANIINSNKKELKEILQMITLPYGYTDKSPLDNTPLKRKRLNNNNKKVK